MSDVLGRLIWRGQLRHVVHNPAAHPVSEHGLDDLPQDGDHTPAQPLVPRAQVEHFFQQEQHDTERRVVTLRGQVRSDAGSRQVISGRIDVNGKAAVRGL